MAKPSFGILYTCNMVSYTVLYALVIKNIINKVNMSKLKLILTRIAIAIGVISFMSLLIYGILNPPKYLHDHHYYQYPVYPNYGYPSPELEMPNLKLDCITPAALPDEPKFCLAYDDVPECGNDPDLELPRKELWIS